MVALGVAIFIFVPAVLLAVLLLWLYVEHRPDRVPILLYHRLIARQAAQRGEVPDDEMIWVSYDTSFTDQMRYLREAGYTTIDLDDYLAIRAGRRPRPPRPVIITFDDGYLSNYTLAYPALCQYGHKAVIFVAPEPEEYTRCIVQGVDDFLDAGQMREMSDRGVSIQSHTLTHCVLTDLDDEAAMYELTESRRRLAAITGRAVDHLAIPRSGYSRRVRKLVRQAGYKTACCNNKGTANGLSSLLALPRIVIERDMSLEDFARCLTPWTGVMLRIVGNLKRVPEWIGGEPFARRVRAVLYASPLRRLFETRHLKKAVAVLALLYLAASLWFAWHLIVQGGSPSV